MPSGLLPQEPVSYSWRKVVEVWLLAVLWRSKTKVRNGVSPASLQ
jgi:hypothetical protein